MLHVIIIFKFLLLANSFWFLTIKVELSKKRPAVSATATQGPDKKAKFITPQKTGNLFLSPLI